MSLNILTFAKTAKPKVAILIKEQAFRKDGIEQHYVKPLLARGFAHEDFVGIALRYNQQGKAPVKLVREHLKDVVDFAHKNDISHFLVCDATYFKVMCKLTRAEPHFGYVLPLHGISPCIKAALTVNYTQLFYNPSLKNRLSLGLTALAQDIQGKDGIFAGSPIQAAHYPEAVDDVAQTLQDLLEYPALTCDIETFGLSLNDSEIASISFGIDQGVGTAFLVQFQDEREDLKRLLRNFFTKYQGILIYHGATFDIKMLIHQLFMSNNQDYIGMITGLDIMCKNIECTMVLTYLATNSAAGNNLRLKHQAFEFAGNYAVDDISDVRNMDVDELLNYNMIDALATWYLYNKYRNQVRDNQEYTYQEVFKPSIRTIIQTELVGLPFSRKQVDITNSELYGIHAKHGRAIFNHRIIKEFEAVLKIEAALDANSKLKKLRKTPEDFHDLEFNVGSNVQLRKLMYDHLGLPVQHYTDTGLASTDGRAIEGVIAWLKKEYDL